jgi:Flp pilus assembly protein TadG
MAWLKTFMQATGGTAAIEFAVLTSAFFLTFLGVLDYGTYFVQDSRLAQAVSDQGNYTFKNLAAPSFTESTIQTYIRQASGSSATVTVTCNGGSDNTSCNSAMTSCSCLSTGGVYATAASCGASCSGTSYSTGAVSGYYLKINASYSFPGMMVLKNASVSRSVTVRLK